MDNSTTQDLTQDRIYESSRGPVESQTMVVTHSVRALDKLVRDHGHGVLVTSFGQALIRRASLEGSVASQVDAIRGDKKMLRASDGRFVGAWPR